MKQIKLKDTKIADKLKGIIAQGYCTDRNGKKNMDSDLMIDCEKAIFNVDISNVDEFVELDVEKIEKMIWDNLGEDNESEDNYLLNTVFLHKIPRLAKAIATTKGVMKWRK